MKKAIFLDRDGTINKEKNYLYRIEDFEFLPGVIEALQILQSKGYLLIIITNQSGIARGYYTEKDYEYLNMWMKRELEKEGIHLTADYYCPHLPHASVAEFRKECECRKPKLGMYEQAVCDFNIDLSSSYAIGDKIRDCSICEHSLCRGFLIGENEQHDIIDRVKTGNFSRVSYCVDLLDASRKIPWADM